MKAMINPEKDMTFESANIQFESECSNQVIEVQKQQEESKELMSPSEHSVIVSSSSENNHWTDDENTIPQTKGAREKQVSDNRTSWENDDDTSKLNNLSGGGGNTEKEQRAQYKSSDDSNNDSQKRFSLQNDDERQSFALGNKGDQNKKGLRLLKRLVERKRNTKILKVGVVMFFIQSTFFILCDMIIYYLIANQVQIFMMKLDLMNGLDVGIGTLQKGFMMFNYRYIIDRGLISRPSDVGKNFQKLIIRQASDKQKQLQKDNVEYVRFLNSIQV